MRIYSKDISKLYIYFRAVSILLVIIVECIHNSIINVGLFTILSREYGIFGCSNDKITRDNYLAGDDVRTD